MIDIVGLSKDYDGKQAVNSLDLHVDAGVLFTFLGPNGAGKTTTMKIMAGLLRPSAGTVRIDGIDVVRDPVSAKSRIGYIPDHPYLYDRLTGWEFLHFVGELYGMGGDDVRAVGEGLVERFDLTDVVHQLVATYSHGMRQRLAFTACFLHQPSVVIVDEPWVGLDPRNVRAAIEYMREQVENGVTVFMSTHSLSIAEECGDRMAILNHGNLIYDGTVENLRGESDVRALEEIFLELTA